MSADGLSAPLGRTRDVSLVGLYLETPQPFDAGTVIPLHLDLEGDGQPLRISAEVVRRDTEGMGLRFQGDDAAAMRKLRRWVVARTSVQGTQRQVEQMLAAASKVEPIRAPARIRQMVTEIRESRAEVILVPPVRVSRDKARLVQVLDDQLVFEAEDRSTLVAGEEIYAVVTLEFVAWSFGLAVRSVEGRVVRCSWPEMIVYSERRGRDRAPVPAGSVIRWPAPWAPGTFVSLPVLERSAEGLSFRVAPEACLLTPGAPLVEAEFVSEGVARKLADAVVRHITPDRADDGTPFLRVGVSFGVPFEASAVVRQEVLTAPKPTGLLGRLRSLVDKSRHLASYALQRGRTRLDPTGAATGTRKVRIQGGRHELVALLDATESHDERLVGPLVVVVPGFAGRKEQMGFLADTIVDGFGRQGRDVAVLRFDGSNNLGESGKDEGCHADGTHALHYTMSGLIEDIQNVLAWARNNPFVEPTHLVLVSVSMSSVAVRHVLTRPETADVGLWVSYMGAPDAVDAIRNVSGNIDLHAYWRQGQRLGVVSLNGVLTDGDRFWEDLHRLGIGDLEAARREMGAIKADVVWLHGLSDAWMDPKRVRQLMNIPAQGSRELIEVDSGHLPRTGEVAVAQFVRITQLIWRHVHRDHLSTFSPPLGRMLARNEAEWNAVRRATMVDRRAWWHGYLLQSDGVGFDILEMAPDYVRFMQDQARHVEPAGAEVLELGAGTGNLTTRLLALDPKRVVATDLVPEALAAVRRKVGEDARLTTQVVDLEGSPRVALRRWLAGDLPGPRSLAERVPGVNRVTLERILEGEDPRVHAALRGHEVDVDALAHDLRWPDTARRLLADLQLLGRLERGRVTLDEARAGLVVLPPSLLDAGAGLPFADASFDAIGMSLVLSYLTTPEDVLFECHRVLRPGGRLVLSSMLTDSDNSKLYLDLVERLEKMPPSEMPPGRNRDFLLNSARTFVDSAAELYRLEEEGLFRFYTPNQLSDVVRCRGFVDVRTSLGFGSPSQAVVITCRRP